MNSRGGTRCRMALTVVRTTVGSLRAVGGKAGQRGDARGDDLGVGADAVVGHRVPGRELERRAPWARRTRAPRPAPPAAGRRARHAAAAGVPLAPAPASRQARASTSGAEPFRHAGQRLAHCARRRSRGLLLWQPRPCHSRSVEAAQRGDQTPRMLAAPAPPPGCKIMSYSSGSGSASRRSNSAERRQPTWPAAAPAQTGPDSQSISLVPRWHGAIDGAPPAAFLTSSVMAISALISGHGRLTARGAAATLARLGAVDIAARRRREKRAVVTLAALEPGRPSAQRPIASRMSNRLMRPPRAHPPVCLGHRASPASARAWNSCSRRRCALPPGVTEPRVIDLLWHTPDRRHRPPRHADGRRGRARHHRHARGARAEAQAAAARQHPGALQGAACEDDTGRIDLVFFHAERKFIERQLPDGQHAHRQRAASRATTTSKQMAHPDYIVAPEARAELPMLEPVYPLTAGLSGKVLLKAVAPGPGAGAASCRNGRTPPGSRQRGWPDLDDGAAAPAPARASRRRVARRRRPGSGSPTTSCWRASWRWRWCARASRASPAAASPATAASARAIADALPFSPHRLAAPGACKRDRGRTWRARAACCGCCRATSARARRSSRCWPWRSRSRPARRPR